MAKNLVIVESPTKAKTLERYLGRDYSVKASYGHIRDLPKNKMGVDTERDFRPEYVVPDGAKKVAAALRPIYTAPTADATTTAADLGLGRMMSTKKDYIGRMMDDKVRGMLKAREYEKDYWDGHRRYGYGGYRSYRSCSPLLFSTPSYCGPRHTITQVRRGR